MHRALRFLHVMDNPRLVEGRTGQCTLRISWQDHAVLTSRLTSICGIYLTIKLIHRSGQARKRFEFDAFLLFTCSCCYMSRHALQMHKTRVDGEQQRQAYVQPGLRCALRLCLKLGRISTNGGAIRPESWEGFGCQHKVSQANRPRA